MSIIVAFLLGVLIGPQRFLLAVRWLGASVARVAAVVRARKAVTR